MQLPVRYGRAQSRAQSRLRWVSVVLAVLGIAASVWVLKPGAPAGLQTAQPDRSAHVGRTPDHVWLDFTREPAPGLAEVEVLSPKDENLAHGPALTSSSGVSQPLAPLRERGAYQVAYEVRLVDGDVARGDYWFWYEPNAPGSTPGLQSAVLLGLLVAAAGALAAGLLAPGRGRRPAVRVPAQRTESPATSAHTVPVQRSGNRTDRTSVEPSDSS